MSWIFTNSGKVVDFLNPDPDSISISEIAHALSQIPRFSGQTCYLVDKEGIYRTYSVAQHSINCALLVKTWLLSAGFDKYDIFSNSKLSDKPVRVTKIILQALLHDATEAYMMDMPAPLKDLIPAYKVIEKKLWSVIAFNYGVEIRFHTLVKEADRIVREAERQALFENEITLPVEVQSIIDNDVSDITGQCPTVVYKEFISIFDASIKTV